MPDLCLVSNSREGRDCTRSLNATRIAWGRPPVAGPCSLCGAECAVPQACEQPMPELPSRIQRNLFTSVGRFFPSTPDARGRWIGGSLGLAGCLYLTWHVLRYLQLL